MIDPATGKAICKVIVGTKADVNIAVQAARKAFTTSWGLKTNGTARARLLYKLADLLEENANEIAALEALDNGKPFTRARFAEIPHAVECIRYFAGWADKVQGNVIETSEAEFVYTRREPIGVIGQIVPWNFPCKYQQTPPLHSSLFSNHVRISDYSIDLFLSFFLSHLGRATYVHMYYVCVRAY